jgi:hypothetical protein
MPLDVAAVDLSEGAAVVKVTGALAVCRDSQKVESSTGAALGAGSS